MSAPFTPTEYKDDYSRSVTYKVHGFWSGDSVRVYQSKMQTPGNWGDVQIRWSTGGRDPNEEVSNVAAAENFAGAILDAVGKAKQWQTQ